MFYWWYCLCYKTGPESQIGLNIFLIGAQFRSVEIRASQTHIIFWSINIEKFWERSEGPINVFHNIDNIMNKVLENIEIENIVYTFLENSHKSRIFRNRSQQDLSKKQ